MKSSLGKRKELDLPELVYLKRCCGDTLASLLEEWKTKKSWKSTLPLCPIYVSRNSGEKDISLSSLCSKERELTLNPNFGFEEIAVADPAEEIAPRYSHLTTSTRVIEGAPESYAKKLVQKLEDYLVDLWNSNRFHVVLCSAGMDSRIISWILAGLRNKMGKDWLGDIHFRCHGYEGSVFKEVMMKQGWKKEQYSVYKDGIEEQLDYYNIGEFSVDINAFHEPTVDFFDDLTRKASEKQIALVSGVCGGEIFCYPLQSQRRFTDNRFQDLLNNTQEIRNRFCKEYNRWGDILAPFLGYEYLDLAFRVPNKNFKWIALNGQEVDLMRASMTNIFNDRIPFCIGHRYNMRISEARAGYMKEKYTGSKFYRHFSHLSVVRKAQPWVTYQNLPVRLDKEPSSTDLKLYGYATMYEKTTRK